MPESTTSSERCPNCGSTEVVLIRRGYAGHVDSKDQYFTCQECGETTYQIISRSRRQVRIDRLDPGRRFRHQGVEYVVSRTLQVGLDEILVYVQPYRSIAE